MDERHRNTNANRSITFRSHATFNTSSTHHNQCTADNLDPQTTAPTINIHPKCSDPTTEFTLASTLKAERVKIAPAYFGNNPLLYGNFPAIMDILSKFMPSGQINFCDDMKYNIQGYHAMDGRVCAISNVSKISFNFQYKNCGLYIQQGLIIILTRVWSTLLILKTATI